MGLGSICLSEAAELYLAVQSGVVFKLLHSSCSTELINSLLKQVLNHPKLLFNELLQVLPEKRNKPGFFFFFPLLYFIPQHFFSNVFSGGPRVLLFLVFSSLNLCGGLTMEGSLRWECGDTGIVSNNGFVLDEQIKALRVL